MAADRRGTSQAPSCWAVEDACRDREVELPDSAPHSSPTTPPPRPPGLGTVLERNIHALRRRRRQEEAMRDRLFVRVILCESGFGFGNRGRRDEALLDGFEYDGECACGFHGAGIAQQLFRGVHSLALHAEAA